MTCQQGGGEGPLRVEGRREGDTTTNDMLTGRGRGTTKVQNSLIKSENILPSFVRLPG
jgi:hypothetical protein